MGIFPQHSQMPGQIAGLNQGADQAHALHWTDLPLPLFGFPPPKNRLSDSDFSENSVSER